MSSLRRIESSRANGARSCGPVTPQGKEASARNSLRHGLLASHVLLDGESRERFIALAAAYTEEYQPVTETEWAMLESMTVARWRTQRIWTIQTADLNREMHDQPAAVRSPSMRAAMAFRKLADTSNSLNTLERYEAHYDMQYHRSMARLLYLTTTRGELPAATSALPEVGTFNEPGPDPEPTPEPAAIVIDIAPQPEPEPPAEPESAAPAAVPQPPPAQPAAESSSQTAESDNLTADSPKLTAESCPPAAESRELSADSSKLTAQSLKLKAFPVLVVPDQYRKPNEPSPKNAHPVFDLNTRPGAPVQTALESTSPPTESSTELHPCIPCSS